MTASDITADTTSHPQLPYFVKTRTGVLRIVANVSLGLAALSALTLFFSDEMSEVDYLFGIGGVLFFGVGGYFLRTSVPGFVTAFDATDEGLTVNSQYGSVGPIPWNDIREIRMDTTKVKFLNLKSIGVVLQDPQRTLGNKNLFKRISGMAAEYTSSSALSVPTMFIDGAAFDVLDNLNAILKRMKSA